MNRIKKIYIQNRNGIIVTLLFHIIVFIVLNINQFRTKTKFEESEILIDLPEQIIQEITNKEQNNTTQAVENNVRTNIASNRAANNTNKTLNDNYENELQRARDLVKDVSKQLSKEIPTIDDLKMPVEKSEGMNADSIMNKLYSGESNVEYYLKGRYHIELPIPVYLSQYAGIVEVAIKVNYSGKVISATIRSGQTDNEQLLSYAKTAALRTTFNSTNTGEDPQNGTITYHFVAQ